MPLHNENTLRNDEPAEWQVEDDYLAARGYPMTARNREVVRNLVVTLPQRLDRKALFRYLDARLLHREPAG